MRHSAGRIAIGLGAGWLVCLLAATTAPAAQQTPAPTPPGRPFGTPADAPPRPPASVKDILEGTDGSDAVEGTDADNWIFGKKGDDLLQGGKGQDAIDGAEGADTLDGGDDDDVLDGGAGADTIRGGAGTDIADGGDDEDLIDGGAGNDDLDGGDGDDVLRGGAGDDQIAGGDNDDTLQGGAGADRLSGDDGADSLAGGADDDRLAGGDGADLLAGNAGNDWLDGGLGNDVLRGGPGDDVLLGSGGTDTLDGDQGHDTLVGADGRDALNGGPGEDWLLGGLGADVIDGGDGADILVLRAGDVPAGELELIDGRGGADILFLNGLSVPAGVVPSELDDSRTGGTYLLRGIERIDSTHLFPHMGGADGISSSLLLVNPASTAAEGRVVFSGEDGAMLAVPAADGATRDDLPFTIPPQGSLRLDTPGAGRAGSAQVFSRGMALGGVTSSALLAGEPALEVAEALLVDAATVPVVEDRASNRSTAVTILNSAIRSIIKLTLHSTAGIEPQTGATEIDLPPYGRRTVLVRDLFPLLGDFRGTMTVATGLDRPQEGGPFTVTVIHRVGQGTAGTSAAISMAPEPAAGALLFGGVTSGTGTASSITLVNASPTQRARGTVTAFDETGAPRPSALEQQGNGGSVPYDLAPYGSLVLTLSSDGPLRNGAARVEPAEGVVGGLLQVALGGTTHYADSSPVLTGFVAPVRHEQARGVTSTLTITGTDLAANLEMTLRDPQGAPVSGGSTTIAVPANGQVVRTLAELFPGLAADLTQATLDATADAPVGVRVTTIDAVAGRVAQMPVLPRR